MICFLKLWGCRAAWATKGTMHQRLREGETGKVGYSLWIERDKDLLLLPQVLGLDLVILHIAQLVFFRPDTENSKIEAAQTVHHKKRLFFFWMGVCGEGGGILCFSGEIISERLLPGDGLKSHRLCYLYMQVFFREHQRFSSFSSAARTCKRGMTHRWYARHLLSNDIIIRQWYWGISLLMHHLIVRIYIGGMLSAACNQWQLIVNH